MRPIAPGCVRVECYGRMADVPVVVTESDVRLLATYSEAKRGAVFLESVRDLASPLAPPDVCADAIATIYALFLLWWNRPAIVPWFAAHVRLPDRALGHPLRGLAVRR